MKNILGVLYILQAVLFFPFSAKCLAIEILADEGYETVAKDIRSKINISEKKSTIVTIGKLSLTKALSKKNQATKVIALYISEEDFAVATYRLSDKHSVTGLFLGVDPRASIAATKVLSPNEKALIVITNKTHVPLNDDFHTYIENNRGNTLKNFYAGDTIEVLKNMNEYRAMVVYPDISILNEATIKALVSNLYRRNKYVVGWTEDQVRQGVLVAPVFNDGKYAGEAVEYVLEAATQSLSAKYSTAFDIKINPTLYRTLAISPELQTSEQLTELVKKAIY